MVKVLWLCSWYPNKEQKQSGDFVQRQAQAVSAFAQVETLFVGSSMALDKDLDITVANHFNWRETVILFAKKRTFFWHRIKIRAKYFQLYTQYIQKYIRENGKPDLIHVQVAMPAGLFALWAKWKYGIRYVVTEHWTLYQMEEGKWYQQKSLLFRKMTERIIRKASLVLPVSEQLAAVMQKRVAPFVSRPVHNVVDTTLFHPAITRSGLFVFIHVSDMSVQKNVKGIIDGFLLLHARCPEAQLWIVGAQSPDGWQYVLPANIRFWGIVDYPQVANLMQQAKVLIVNSDTETFSCVIAEALCCGLPVISTEVGIAPEVITYANGVLIPFRNPASLSDAMEKTIQEYAGYDRAGIARKAQAQFNYEAIGKSIAAIYNEILDTAK